MSPLSITPAPFTVAVPDALLDDLRVKLSNARLPAHFDSQCLKDPTKYGVDTKLVEMLREYWLNGYDWRKHEAKINAFRQFKLPVQGLLVFSIL